MRNYKLAYYDQTFLWERDCLDNPDENSRIKESISVIPDNVRTLLDIGCGNGAFINALVTAYPNRFEKVVGIDLSVQALGYVTSPKIINSVANLSFRSRSFDLVSCLEVLEHLGEEEFRNALSEIQRVSKKYIVITVPNDEILEKELVLCPKCSCAFNPFFHVRRFDKMLLMNLFDHFKNQKIKGVGPQDHNILYRNVFYFIRLGLRKPAPPYCTVCPQCGYTRGMELTEGNAAPKMGSSNYQKLFSFLKRVALGRGIQKKRWLLALYSRCDET
jgi:SAM-dependent methyltransferase